MSTREDLLRTEEHLHSPTAPALFLRTWRPSTPARAIVVLVHGFNAHSGAFAWAGEELASAGYAVYAGDLRGRGQSEGERFYVDSFDDYVSDVDRVVDAARSREGDKPLFLLGHSAGGVVACLYGATHPVAGVISESFALQLPAPGFALAALKGLSHFLPHVHVVRLKNEDFSRDPTVVATMNNDPLIAGEVQATKTIAALVRADAQIKTCVDSLRTPVLILHGTADHATDPAGSQWFFDHVAAEDKTLRLYDGYVHDLFRDTGREAVLADVLRWLSDRTA